MQSSILGVSSPFHTHSRSMFHYNSTYQNVPPPLNAPSYVSTTLKMLYDETPPRIHFCTMCGGPLCADVDVNVGQSLKDEIAEKKNWEGTSGSKWFERFRGIVVKSPTNWGFGSPSGSEDESITLFSDGDGNTSSEDAVMVSTGNGDDDTSSPSLSGSPTTFLPRQSRNFNGTSTRLTGVGYVSESEPEFGVLPHLYSAQIFPDNDDGSEEEYHFYTAANDNAATGIEMIPAHEYCWEQFMKAVGYWCDDVGVKLNDAGRWWITSDVVWRFFTVGYWDSAVDERLQMVRWAYGKRIVENHEKGRWEVRKGEGWWLSEPSDRSIWHVFTDPPLLATSPPNPTAPSSLLTPSSCPPSLTSPTHYPPSSKDIFNTLPADIALHIFTFLPSLDIRNLRIASRPISAVHLPQSLFRRVLHTEYRFFSNSVLTSFLADPMQRYKIDWKAFLVLLNKALAVPGPLKNQQRIYRIIERLTEELCETAPRTLKELRRSKVDWEKFTFTLHDGGLIRGYDVEGGTAETALFGDDDVYRIRVFLNPDTGRMTGLSFLGAKSNTERRFGLATRMSKDIIGFEKMLGFIVALGTGSRIMGIQFLLMVDDTTVRTQYFGLPPDIESGETGTGYYKLVIPRMFRQEYLVGITGLCDQHGIRAIGLLAPLKVLQDEYFPFGPLPSSAVVEDSEMDRNYTGGDDDHKPVTGPWRTLDVPEGFMASVGSDCDVAFAGRAAGDIVSFEGLVRVSGWWDNDGLRGLVFERRGGEEVRVGVQIGEYQERLLLDWQYGEVIEGVMVTGGLREAATAVAFVTSLGRCSEFFGPKFVGCPTHFVPGRGPLARVDDRIVSALHYAYSITKKRFTRLGIVAVIPPEIQAAVLNDKGKGKETAKPSITAAHEELMLKTAQTILPFESRDAQGSLWEDVMPSANEYIIEKDKNRPDIIDGGCITWCGTVWTEKALRRIEVWGEVRGVRFMFVDGTTKGFGLIGRSERVKVFQYPELEGRWLVSCSWGKVKVKTSWAGEYAPEGQWRDEDYKERDEEGLDDDEWDCTEVTQMNFRTRPAQGKKPKTLPAGYKFNHTVTSIRGLAAIFSLPYAPQYLQKLPRPKIVYRSGHTHPTHPLCPDCVTIATPPIPFLRKYEYEFFDGDKGEKLEAIIAYMGVDAWKPFKGLRFRREGSGWSDVFGEVGETMAIFELEGGRVERAFYRMGLGPWLDAVAFATATKASPYFGKECRGTEHEVPMDKNWIPIGVYSIRTQVTHMLGNFSRESYVDFEGKNQFGLLCREALPEDKPIRTTTGEPQPSSEPIAEFFQPRCEQTGRLWKSDILSLPRDCRMAPLFTSTGFKLAIQVEEGNVNDLTSDAFLTVDHRRTFAIFDPERLKRIYICWRNTTLPVCGLKVPAICHIKFRDFEKMDEILIGDAFLNPLHIRSLTRNGEDSGPKGWKVERIDIDGLGGERITKIKFVFRPWLCAMAFETNFGRCIFAGADQGNDCSWRYRSEHEVNVADGSEVTGMHVDTTWIVDWPDERYCDKIGVVFRPSVEG